MFTSKVKKVYGKPEDVTSIKKGDECDIESGLGGSYDVVVESVAGSHINIKITNIDHEHKQSILKLEAHKVFYKLEAA